MSYIYHKHKAPAWGTVKLFVFVEKFVIFQFANVYAIENSYVCNTNLNLLFF